jgi:hypothetical protein
VLPDTVTMVARWPRTSSAVGALFAIVVASAAACSLGDFSGYSSGPSAPDDGGAGDANAERGPNAAEGGTGSDRYRDVVIADGPISYWRLDETSGTRCKDEMGHHDGTYDTDVTFGAPGAIAGSGTAALFTLESGTIAIGNAFEFPDLQPFSFEAWVKPTSVPTSGTIFATTTFDPNASYRPSQGTTFFLSADGVGFERWGDELLQFTHLQNRPLEANAWSHLVVTFDGTLTKLYVNGGVASVDGTGRPMPKTPRPFAWGTMKGAFDELAVYDHALSPVRVLAHYTTAHGSP